MARLRYSLTDAEQEAGRLATEHVQKMALWPGVVLSRVVPSRSAPRSPNSKHPVWWMVSFKMPWPDGVVVDGCELMFDVNVETKEVRQFDVG
jgi:hypothetical protein